MIRSAAPTLAVLLLTFALLAGCADESGDQASESSTFTNARTTTAVPDVPPIVAGPAAYHANRLGDAPGVEKALQLYFLQQHEASLDSLEALIARGAAEPELHVWRALNLQQLGRPLDAREAARRALGGDPELGMAHAVIGDTYSSVADAELVDDNAAWEHYVDAVEARKTAPYAWFDVWREAVVGDRPDWEERALLGIASAELFTDALLANVRWMMTDAPRNAVFVVNGDMDTYPALALQAAENLRPDLAIVNQALLNDPDYIMEVVERFGLTWPTSRTEIDAMVIQSFENETLLISEQIISRWADDHARGISERPVAAALTVHESSLPSIFWLSAVFEGGCRTYHHDALEIIDAEAIDRSLTALDADVIMGDYVSPKIVDPGMLAAAMLIGNPVTTGLRSAQASFNAGDLDRARACFAVVERLVMTGGLEGDFAVFLQEFRGALNDASR